jgi:3-oxoadipate enol-lactonase
MQVEANGIEFNTRIDGHRGLPWLVLSNSLATNLSMWDHQVEALRDRFRILRYDQRGHGESDAPAGRYDFHALVADVIGLFDALEIKQAHFAGLSMGGMTAIALAQQHPDRVDRVVACDCGPASTPQSAQQWEERIAMARDHGMQAVVQPTIDRWFPAEFISANADVIEKVRHMIRTTPLNGFIGCAHALSHFDLRPGLAGIRNPVQFICGSRDASLAGTKALHAAVSGSGFVEIAGAGHISNMEDPTAFTHAMQAFLMA